MQIVVVMMGGGRKGCDRGSYFIPPKFAYPTESLLFQHIPQENPSEAVNCAYVIINLS